MHILFKHASFALTAGFFFNYYFFEKTTVSQVQKIPNFAIKYIKHYKSTEYMKRTTLSINMIGNEKQKTWQKNTIFTSKMLKGVCPC